MPRRLGATARVVPLLLAGCVTACGGSSSPTTALRTAPDLPAFLRLPIATPSACPPSVNGTTVGRRSPWAGHVDISVFVNRRATKARVRGLRAELAGEPEVRAVYFESQAEAYAEFRRLYTCSTSVKAGQLPASYRLLLHAVTQPTRDDLVRRIYTLPGVTTVSCDPSNPCVDVGRSGG